MVPLQYVCLFVSLAVVQADLKNYNNLIHNEKNEVLGGKSMKTGSINDNTLGIEQRSDLNDELNLVSDDRIPLDYNVDEKSTEYKPKNTNPVLKTGLINIASAVIEDMFLNKVKVQFDYKECINAMANIIEEEELVFKMNNLTKDAIEIISNATQIIIHCHETNTFSSCLTQAINEVGAAFIGVAEDIEHVLFAMLVVGEKLFQQIKLCFGRSDLPLADVVYALQHFIQFSDYGRLKKESVATNEVPKVEKQGENIASPKNNNFFSKRFSNMLSNYYKV